MQSAPTGTFREKHHLSFSVADSSRLAFSREPVKRALEVRFCRGQEYYVFRKEQIPHLKVSQLDTLLTAIAPACPVHEDYKPERSPRETRS